MRRIREQAPTLVTNPTVAVLVTAPDMDAVSSAAKYVRSLPALSNVSAWCSRGGSPALREAARRKGTSVTVHASLQAAIRTANLCMVFGHSPFSSEDMRILSEQGIAVEVHASRHG